MRELEEENEDLKEKMKMSEKRKQDLEWHFQDMDREMRLIMNEKEREQKQTLFQQATENKFKEENRSKLLDDIQNMIKQYKHEKVIFVCTSYKA